MLQERIIDRKAMPQIQAKDIPDALNYLKKNGISNKKESIPAGRIIPMQRLNMAKVEALKSNTESLKKPVLVTKDYELVDGHHRWAANKELGNNQTVIKLNATFDEVYEALTNYSKVFYKDMHESMALVIRSQMGNSIDVSINGKRYEYIVDGDPKQIYRTAINLAKYSAGKAINHLKKYAIETIKEQEKKNMFLRTDINMLLEGVFILSEEEKDEDKDKAKGKKKTKEGKPSEKVVINPDTAEIQNEETETD